MLKKDVLVIETNLEVDIKEEITKRVHEVVKEEIEKCSKEYLRNIKTEINVVVK